MHQKGIVNFQYLSEVSEGDDEFIQQMVEVFLEESPGLIANLLEGATNQDWNKISMSAHTLKTSLRLMGVADPVEKVVLLELWSKEKEHLDKIPDLIKFTETVVNQCTVELTDFLRQSNGD